MKENDSSKSFLDARDHLSRALNELEKVIFDKLAAIKENKNPSVNDPQGQKIISGLNHEINSLQKTLAEIGLEISNCFLLESF